MTNALKLWKLSSNVNACETALSNVFLIKLRYRSQILENKSFQDQFFPYYIYKTFFLTIPPINDNISYDRKKEKVFPFRKEDVMKFKPLANPLNK